MLPFVAQGYYGSFVVLNPEAQLSGLIAGSVRRNDRRRILQKSQIDYAHGDDVVFRLANEKRNLGFLLPPMGKNKLFTTVMREGALPRKTFSMGEAHEKRYYLECKKIL